MILAKNVSCGLPFDNSAVPHSLNLAQKLDHVDTSCVSVDLLQAHGKVVKTISQASWEPLEKDWVFELDWWAQVMPNKRRTKQWRCKDAWQQ